MVTKQKVPQSPISFSMHPHIFGKHAMKSEPLGMNSTYFFSVYNTLPQCKIGQDKLGMGHFLTLTNSHCMDSSSEHFKSGCQFSLTTMENKTIARTFSTITCAPLWTYLVFHVLRINFRENAPYKWHVTCDMSHMTYDRLKCDKGWMHSVQHACIHGISKDM